MPSANLQNLDIFYFSSNFNSFSWWVKKKSYFFSIFMWFFSFNRLCQELQIVYRWIHVQVASWVSLCCQCWFLWEFMSSKLIFMEVYVKVNFCVSLCSFELIMEGVYVVYVDFRGSFSCPSWFWSEFILSKLILEGVYLVQVDFGVSLCCPRWFWSEFMLSELFLWEFVLSELILTGVYVVFEFIYVGVYVVQVDFGAS